MNDSVTYVNERSTIKANISRTVRDREMTRSTFGDISVIFHSPKFDRNRGSQWMHFCLYMSHRISHVLLFTNKLSVILPTPSIEIPSIWLADRNSSSNRGPGYSTQNGIALSNAWFFPSVILIHVVKALGGVRKSEMNPTAHWVGVGNST